MAQLYDRYSTIVYSVALRILGDAESAEDVLQDVFMHLWRNSAAFDASRGSMAGWLAIITRNRAIDSKRKRRPQVAIEDVVVAGGADPADSAEKGRFARKIRGALEGMPALQRSALEMAFFQGLTHTEIALQTGEPLGTIKTRIRSAVLSLREALTA
jgi:RNA polymerase sigma-70 factor (ECF subfamily)